ncbi:MAG: NarK/NasA family nitrate transporter [Candidatus Hydrogenedentes bacterium]|nr:NarK/NasA family nitrate transporter [Candidatus Hydrogenedentota bacterium]
MKTLERWEPENPEFWESTGKRIAWRTLSITTAALVLSFATWFAMSAIVVRLPLIGFSFSQRQLFWLAAIPGLAGGTLRMVHTFLIPIYGTRNVITAATFIKLLPCIGIGLAVMNPGTPFWVFLLLALLLGFGGGDFSSFMPSTSLFFPKRLQGTILGIQAGIGNFGVSLAQFVTPWIIGAGVFGAVAGGPQTVTSDGASTPIWIQNATFWYLPLLVVLGVVAWSSLRSVPVKATFAQQLDIFRSRHTWFMTSLYIMTFGSFSGFSATFPLLIGKLYGHFENAPDPLLFAFIGPLVGSITRILAGPPSDKWGGAVITSLSGLGLFACAIGVTFFTTPDSIEEFPYFVLWMVGLFLFAGIGNASTFRQIPVVFEPRQAGGVLGWTAAIAAYGPFVFGVCLGEIISRTGSPNTFFYAIAAFYVVNIALNWWCYTRRGCDTPC